MTKRARPRTVADSPPRTPVTLSPARRRLFGAITVLVPVLAFGGLELALRAVDYGGDLRLVTRRSVGNEEYYVINRAVGRRYFAQAGTVVPEPAEDMFEVIKSPATIRIFCLGESTMAGFPYEFHATAPGFLRDRLQLLLPSHTIEVVNVGLSAVGSFVVLDFIEELSDYQPDLFIVYLGHNEFYGVYGAGSTASGGRAPWINRLTLRLLKLRTFLLLRDATAWLAGLSARESADDARTLMAQVVGEKLIPYGSPLYEQARETYGDNLRSIIKVAHDRRVPLLFSALVSNIRDQPPFQAVHATAPGSADRARWGDLVRRGDSTLAQRDTAAALEVYAAAGRSDTLNADPFYRLGRVAWAAGRFETARTTLVRAKDLDALRFRITEQFQADLRAVCAGAGVPVAPVDSVFAAASPNGIVGTPLILEHLHPSFRGYFLMAKAFTSAIRRNGLVARAEDWAQETVRTDSMVFEASTVSDFDSLHGAISVEMLRHRWPFVVHETEYAFRPANPVEAIVLRYIRKQVPWSGARFELAAYYAAQRDFQRARRECFAVAKVVPFSYDPLLRVADYYRAEGDTARAEEFYRRSAAVEDNPFARMKLAVLLMEGNRAAEAAREIEAAFAVHERTTYRLKPADAAAARYLLGGAYATLGDIPRARRELQRALAIDPSQRDARELLEKLPQ